MRETAQPVESTSKPARRQRKAWWNGLGLVIAAAAVVGALCFWVSSDEFANLVRRRLIAQIEKATGGRVEIGAFHWSARRLEADAEGIVVHGTEDPGEAPYAQIDRLHAAISVIGVFSPQIRLRDLEAERPQMHLIFYPNGSTNQPQPRQRTETKKPGLDTLFSLQAGHIAIEQGLIDLDNRASSFDSLNRYLPLDFQANDFSILMKYQPAAGKNVESYHIETGVRDLNLLRGGESPTAPPAVHGLVQAELDLDRNEAVLRSLRLTASSKGVRDRTMEVTGTLRKFAKPYWNAKVLGDLDLHLLNPIVGYPFAPEGVAHLDLTAAGGGGDFRIDGPVTIDGGTYIQPGVTARDLQVSTSVHADPNQLHISKITVHLRDGGQIDSDLLLERWLPHVPGQAQLQALEPARPQPKQNRHFWNRRKAVPPPPPPDSRTTLVKDPPTEITVNGTITAKFYNVALDTILDVVGQEPFKRLGIDSRLNGPATAKWVNGDVNTLAVSAVLGLSPSASPVAGEAPGSGLIDGTYTQKDGAVDLHALSVSLPVSHIEAHGHLGAFPLSSATDMNVDFSSRNLGEFDPVLRDLGLRRNGKIGSRALPLTLAGEADFHGNWAGSLLSPHLSGDLKASQIALELPPTKNGSQRSVRFDSVTASGSYGADRISVLRAELRRGAMDINADGTLSSPSIENAVSRHHARGDEMPSFDEHALLHSHIRAANVSAAELINLAGSDMPVQGAISAQFETTGPLDALSLTGGAELTNSIAYGEPLESVRAQGGLHNQFVTLSSIDIRGKAGHIGGSATYDLNSHHFEAHGQTTDLDVARIEHVKSWNQGLTGLLSFQVNASGTADDPQIDGHASLSKLAVGSDPVGSVEIKARTENHQLVYTASSAMEAAELNLRGQTAFHGDFATDARIDFSRFNVGALIKLAHWQGLTADSAMAGFATVRGPLANPEKLEGEANLQSAAMTLSGVHLQCDGRVHASLTNGNIKLEPVHITGDHTDISAQGTLGLKQPQPLDLKAGGAINLKLAETLDHDLTAGGTTTFQVEAHGPLSNPGLRGRIDFDNGSLSLEDVPNGLSQLHGTLEFNQNRLEVRSLTAMTGGGQLSVGGYLAYQNGLYADLSVSGKSIRIRYPQGVSSLADISLNLQGVQPNLLLSGNVLLTRFSVSPDLDIAALATQANAVQQIAAPDAPSNHIRLDVRVQSSPQLNFQNAYAKLAGDVDLRLRGTVASPSLLGRVSITEGNATIAGTRYELQRGDIQFTNPVRIQPSIDLNATARVEDYDITLGLHGTPEKLNISYRSDPPLPEADVVALLALGRTQSEQGLYTQQQEQSAGLNPSTDVLLGGALNATVSSRVQKLFGAGSVKVDPNYLGALGNSTTRITVDEQLGKNVTLTYATNVDTSAQQLLQAEVAINRHVSLLVARDESGVFSMVLKATRRYR